MNYKNIFGVDFEFSLRAVVLLGLLSIFPNILGTIHILAFGYRFHLFQIMVFLSAFIFGPLGGAISGAAGSVFTSIALNNPYILVGNVILGSCTGIFYKKGLHPILSAMCAYGVQLPFLWVSDIYWAGMSQLVVEKIVIALFISNIFWAFVALKVKDAIKEKMVG